MGGEEGAVGAEEEEVEEPAGRQKEGRREVRAKQVTDVGGR